MQRQPRAHLQLLRSGPLWVSLLALALAVVAVVLSIADRHLNVDVPVPEPTSWFVPIQVAGAVVSPSPRGRCCRARSRLVVAGGGRRTRSRRGRERLRVGCSRAHRWHVGIPLAEYTPFLATWTLTVELPVLIWMVVTLPGGRFGRSRLDRIGRVAVAAATAGVVAGALTDPRGDGGRHRFRRRPQSACRWDSMPLAVSAMLVVASYMLHDRCARDPLASNRRTGPRRAAVVRGPAGRRFTAGVIPLISFGPEELSVTVAQILTRAAGCSL